MTPTNIAILIIALLTICLENAQGSALFNRMMGRMFTKVSQCTDELQDKLSPEICLTQFDGDKSPNDAQFDSCKQAMTCAMKKLEYMTEEGKWDDKKILALRDGLQDQEAITEFDKAYSSCSSVEGTNSEAVVNMISCLLSNSEKAKHGYNELKETFLSGYDYRT